MKKLGLVGWRGMVGSVLIERMALNGDFKLVDCSFFSTSQNYASLKATIKEEKQSYPVYDAFDINQLMALDIIISCQGSDYTQKVLHHLRAQGWNGYWIDAASYLRLHSDSLLILDPINRKQIDRFINDGGKNFVGANCTVSLMAMALQGLLEQGWVEWINSSTYQAASGGGAQLILKLLQDMQSVVQNIEQLLNASHADILCIEAQLRQFLNQKLQSNQPLLVANAIPWIDEKIVESGQTREEWKGMVELNKLLANQNNRILVDGICTRIGTIRCHSQALTIKLKRSIPMTDIQQALLSANTWVALVENTKEATQRKLNSVAVSGQLSIMVGRLRTLAFGPEYISLFTVGDQLLWGAAEPLRRLLRILIDHNG